MNKLNSKYISASFILAIIFGFGLAACQQDYLKVEGENVIVNNPELNFRAMVEDAGTPAPATRDLTQTPLPIEPGSYNVEFFIEVNDPSWEETTIQSKFGAYIVDKTGKGGYLTYDGEQDKKLNWFQADTKHRFWSWTLPWIDVKGLFDNDSDNPGNPEKIGADWGYEPQPDADENNKQDFYRKYLNDHPITLRLRNTDFSEFTYTQNENKETMDSTWNEGSWGNGYFLEKFIGAYNDNLDFKTNGSYVPLQFNHLVSKIALRKLTFYAADGSTQEDLKANITFINMPDEFTFYPHPNKTDENGDVIPYTKVDGVKVNGDPIVITNFESAQPNKGLTFGYTNPYDFLPQDSLDNKTQYRDKFYICPEIDFSKVSFKVELSDEKYMKKGEYYGDLSQVVFERTPGVDYDNPNPEEGERVDDSTILHAGEVMYFDLIVREIGGGGYRIYVENWSNRTQQPGHCYPHRGLYEDGDAVDLGGTALTGTDIADTWREKFELYGEGFTDGEAEPDYAEWPDHLGVFHQYSDLVITNSTTFNLPKDYILDGMGYELTFRYPGSMSTVLTIGKMKDIYLTIDTSGGTYTIYIDPEGWICKYNPQTGQYERTEEQITEDENYNKYQIDLKTGELISKT